MKDNNYIDMILTCGLALSIPCVLLAYASQSRRYESLNDEVVQLEKKQEMLIEDNKRLVTDISLLSASPRVERIAVNELGMHRAQSSDIIRVELGRK